MSNIDLRYWRLYEHIAFRMEVFCPKEMTFFSSARLASLRLMGHVWTWCDGRCFYPHMLNIRRERLSYHSRILNQVYSNNSPRLLLKVLQDPSKMRYRPLRCVHRCALLHGLRIPQQTMRPVTPWGPTPEGFQLSDPSYRQCSASLAIWRTLKRKIPWHKIAQESGVGMVGRSLMCLCHSLPISAHFTMFRVEGCKSGCSHLRLKRIYVTQIVTSHV